MSASSDSWKFGVLMDVLFSCVNGLNLGNKVTLLLSTYLKETLKLVSLK